MKRESRLLLQQVRVVDPVSETDQIADVLIANGKIQAIETHLDILIEETAVLNAQGLILASGLVDLYSRSGEPGYEERETLLSLAIAAAAGGFTRVVILPDTTPRIDNPAVLAALWQKSQAVKTSTWDTASLDFWGALSLGLEGQQMTELFDLTAAGVVGFADGYPLENLGLLRRLLEYLKPLNKPVALVAANRELQGNGIVREGVASIRYGLPGNPAVSEAAAVASILEVVAATETPVHLMRVSTRRSVELIADAKARGLPITASTTWLHLLLNTEALENYNPNLRLEPPLGNETDRKALIEGIKQGVIDVIAIDHTPYTHEEKALAFAEAPPGTIGLELALPLLWHRFVATGEWTALQLWQVLSRNPQVCLHQQPNSFSSGQPAEVILFDPQKTWIVEQHTLLSLSKNTPWLGKQLTGRVIKVWNSS